MKLKNNKKEKNKVKYFLNFFRVSNEINLTAVNFTGLIVPRKEQIRSISNSDYKIVCVSGLEYFIVADSSWKETLSKYAWKDVRLKGLLNISNMTVVPKKIIPKGPSEKGNNLIDIGRLMALKKQDLCPKSAGQFLMLPKASHSQ